MQERDVAGGLGYGERMRRFFPEYEDADFEGREGHSSLEEAARGDIPAQYAKVVQVKLSRDKNQAIVLLATNEPPAIEYYEEYCSRFGDKWFSFGGGNASGPRGEWPWSA